jgi:predicted DNA-binding transcriptional regulator AlpA
MKRKNNFFRPVSGSGYFNKVQTIGGFCMEMEKLEEITSEEDQAEKEKIKKPDFETIDDLAERWQVPKSWIYARTREKGPGSIPRVKLGKYLRFRPAEVDAWAMNE